MKKYIIAIAALSLLFSCRSLKEEWDPVLTFGEPDAAWFTPVTEQELKEKEGLETISTIADLKKLYDTKAVDITDNIWIKGQVTSSDESGNLYSEMYIQDAQGNGIDLRIGKGSLHNEYPLGMWVYVKCRGLTLAAYKGQPQLGMEADQTATNEYESSNISLQGIIDTHIFRGFIDKPVAPTKVTLNDISTSLAFGYQGKLWGKLVTLTGLKYGSTFDIPAIYALLYPNPNLAHKSDNPENRIFLSRPQDKTGVIEGFDYTWNIKTWGLSKSRYIQHIQDGDWDEAEVDSGNKLTASFITRTPYEILTGTAYEDRIDYFGMDAFSPYKDIMIKNATANYVSHYFLMQGKQDIQVRTSGYAKFADEQVPASILDGSATVSITGIMSVYTGSTPWGVQITLVDDPSVAIVVE